MTKLRWVRHVTVACLWATPAFSAPCDSLAALVLKDAKITSAQVVAAGQFSPPGGPQAAEPQSV